MPDPRLPGPAHYEPQLPKKNSILVDIYKHADIDKRFNAMTIESPGPGYYGAGPKPLLKKTFNVTFDPPKLVNQELQELVSK